jgi:hypothetical protein
MFSEQKEMRYEADEELVNKLEIVIKDESII